MDDLVVGIDPVLLAIGPFTLRWYGLMIAVGIALGVLVALREARRLGVSEDAVYSVALWGTVGGLVGARLFHVIDRIDFYIQNPGAVLAMQQGGLAVWGAVVGGVAAGALYCRLAGLPIARTADLAAPALLLGQTVGRLGNLINGDAYGGWFDAPWSLIYVHQDALIPDLGEPTHPYPLYEMLWNAVALGLIWRLRRQPHPDGTVFLVYLMLYALGRFTLGFVRQETVLLFGLQQAQLVALCLIALGLPLLWRRIARPAPAQT
ncbi:MAG TPA: prolipoprotein diacylglyceryl transferase [Chloroflexota bacterium]